MNETVRVKLLISKGYMTVNMNDTKMDIQWEDRRGFTIDKTIFYNTVSETAVYVMDEKKTARPQILSVVITWFIMGSLAVRLAEMNGFIGAVFGLFALAGAFFVYKGLLRVLGRKYAGLVIKYSGTAFEIKAKNSEKEKLYHIKAVLDANSNGQSILLNSI